MTVGFAAIFILFYVLYLIDWKGLLDVVRQGAWASFVIYFVVGVLCYKVVTAAPAVAAHVMHH